MWLEAFNPEDHYQGLVSALEHRKEYIPTLSELPKIGYVVCEDTTPIAYGFLRMVEGGAAIIDGLATDPRVTEGSKRWDALQMVFIALVRKSQALDIKQLMGFSVNNRTIEIAEKYGFVKLSHTLMSLSNRKV